MANNENDVKLTNSQAKRAQRKKEAEKKKRQEARDKAVGYIIILAVIAIIAAIIVSAIVKSASKVKASDDYSACLDSNGYIMNANADDILLADYKNIVVPLSEVEYADEKVDGDIESALSSHKVMNPDESLVVADGDEVNIDYVGTVDGVEFDGGSAQGYDLGIGSGAFIPGFEEQIVGAQVGSTFDINVTFPEDYSDELAGKDAVFTVTVNGINELPELTDEFIAEYYGDQASTVEEYKQYLKDTNYDKNLDKWIQDYLEANTSVSKYNNKYIKNLKSTIKNDDLKSYDSMSQIYEQIYGYSYFNSFEDYIGMDEQEYNDSLVEKAQEQYKNNFLYQSILQLEGASVDKAYYESVNGEGSFDTRVESYGEPYALQSVFKNKVTEIVKPMVTVQ